MYTRCINGVCIWGTNEKCMSSMWEAYKEKYKMRGKEAW